jgi:hypothetical protein
MNPLTQSKNATILPVLIALMLACFGLSPDAWAKPGEDRGNGNSAAEHVDALNLATTGSNNTAHGWFSLFSNTTGSFNTADGFQALYLNTLGHDNTAVGHNALQLNTDSWNTALGSGALQLNNRDANTAVGYQAAAHNISGFSLCAFGFWALYSNTDGVVNNAFGSNALYNNTTGEDNDAVGYIALYNNRTGINNDAIGAGALYSNVSGSNNVAIGRSAGLLITGDGNVCIGANVLGVNGENNVTRIKNIGTTPQDTGIYATLDAVGGTKLGYVNRSSSRRFKQDIKPMDNASEAIFSLKPVNFRYKKELDPNQTERFGLVAEDVEKVNPDLVARNEHGELTTVRYEAVNAMLLNEFLKEHRKVEQLEKEVERLTAGLQKVSAELELSKPAPQTVLNNQ